MALTKEQVMNATCSELDELVALAQGWHKGEGVVDGLVWFDGEQWHKYYNPSTNGSQCMALMERERVSVWDEMGMCWCASIDPMDGGSTKAIGETAMIAICRCFVLSKGEVNSLVRRMSRAGSS